MKRVKTYKTDTEPVPQPALSTPSVDRTAPSPVLPTSIGPTPHRDGKVLGLFAFLDETPQKTPSKRPASALETPSKSTQEDSEDFKLGRTPSSVSKRRYLDNLVTPLKPTDGNAQARTPVSVSKLQFGTPSFLRRRPLAAVEEMPEYQSPEKLRKTTRRPFARGLSAIVAGLRKVEESRFDEEEEAMREMEMGMEGPPLDVGGVRPVANAAAPMADSQVVPDAKAAPETQAAPDAQAVPDTQAVPETQVIPDVVPPTMLLGGFDDEAAYDSPVEEQLDRGRPMKEYKKKGQKRTTRRVNMKPTFIKRPAEEVPVDLASDAETEAGDSDGEYAGDRKRKAEVEGPEKGTVEKEGKVRRAARKVNELAHANFRRLKLRGKGAGGGGGGRFRRR